VSEINISEQDRLHQLLCAYVLGEADASERVEVEAALARDPALREERARLEATIGIVQGAMGKDETLSYRATTEVTRAATLLARGPDAPVRVLPWYRATTLRAAASIVSVVGASFLGWKAFVAGPMRLRDAAPADREVAKLDALQARSEKGEPYGKELTGLGYLDGSSSGTGYWQPPAGQPAASSPAPDPLVAREQTEAAPAELSEEDASDALYVRRAALQPGTSQPTPEQLRSWGERQEPQPTTALSAAEGKSSDLFYLDAKNEAEKRAAAGAGTALGLDVFGGIAPQPPAEGAATNPGAPAPTTEARVGLVTAGGGGGGAAPLLAAKPAQAPPPATASGPSTPGALSRSNLLTPGDPFAGSRAKAAAGEAKKLPGESDAEEEVLYVPAAKVAAAAAPTSMPVEEQLKALGYLSDNDETSRDDKLSEFELADRLKKDGSDEYYLGQGERGERRRILTPQERQARIEQVIASCRPRPNERPRDMFFRFWGDNPFEWSATDRQSTFSMDVDTASYTLARKYLVENHLPEKAQIRTEEFVNYFAPDVASPKAGTFAIATELAPGRFVDRPDKWMLRVAVRGREVPVAERAPLALTFVIDVSGSMKEEQRLELVKNALRMLITQLDARDSVAIVAFSSDTRLMLPMTSAAKRDLIESAIQPLQPDGSTNTEAGLRMGYEQALAALTKNATNRVVLLTDGVANVGITDPNALVQHVERQRKAGIYLNTIGVGMDNHNDNLLEQLADKGDGLCNYVDDAAEVQHALVDNFLRTMVPIARDAKVQVEFDPAQVESYRLLGYENRAIADQDFRNDKIDAGEINSGHQITALYEIVRTNAAGNGETPLATVRVRFKPPHKDGIASAASEEASELSKVVTAREAAGSFEATSHGYRRAVLAAQFAEFLRRSVHARGDSLERLIDDLQRLNGERNDPQVAELRDMVLKSKALLEAEFANYGELQRRLDRLRSISWERARLDSLQREIDRARLSAMDQEIAGLERSLREEFERRQVK